MREYHLDHQYLNSRKFQERGRRREKSRKSVGGELDDPFRSLSALTLTIFGFGDAFLQLVPSRALSSLHAFLLRLRQNLKLQHLVRQEGELRSGEREGDV